MKINQLKIGSVLSYAQMALGVLIGLVYTPVMIRLLGQSEYGLYNTVSSTIAMMSILNLGFNSGYIRYYARYKKDGDLNSIYKLNGLFLMLFVFIGLTALVCGIFLSCNLELVFADGLTNAEYKTAKTLMLILTANMAISFPMSVFANIITSNERFVFVKLLGIMKTVGSPMLTIPLLLAGYRSVGIVAVTVCIALITDIFYMYYVLNVLKNKFVFKGINKGIASGLFSYTVFIAINIVVDQINNNIDKFLLARYCGTAMVAIYSVGYALYNHYLMFSTAISSVFTPRIHSIVNKTKNDLQKQKKELTTLFIKVGRVQFIVLALIATGLMFFGKQFILNYWAGKGYEQSYFVMLLLVFPSTIALIQNLGIEIQRAQNKHQFRSIAYFIMAISNLVLTIMLCPKFGAVGATIGTALSLLLANGLVMNIYYYKKCNIDIPSFWKSIIRLSSGLAAPIAFGIIVTAMFNLSTMTGYVTACALYVLIYCISMWLVGMNEYEKSLIRKVFMKFSKSKS